MSTRERILTIRLSEKISKYPAIDGAPEEKDAPIRVCPDSWTSPDAAEPNCCS